MVMWSLWNPITSRLIRLPQLQDHEKGDSYDCCLSSPPDDPSSILLLAVIGKPIIFFCRLNCKRKKLRWTKMPFANQLKSMHVTDDNSECNGYLGCLTYWNDKIYGCTLGLFYRLVIQVNIVVDDNEAVISLLPIVKTPSLDFRRCSSISNGYMLGFSTELFYIRIFEDERRKTVGEVFLFKLDMTNMMWEETADLEVAIFVSVDSTVMYRPQLDPDLGGYIHIVGKTGQVIYSYNVKSKNILLSSMPSLLQTRQVSAWTVLDQRSLGDHQQEEDMNDMTVVRSVRDANVDFYSTTVESDLHNIPFDVLQRILEFCSCVDYMNFRAAGRRCRLAAPPIQWSRKTELRRFQTHSLVSPWLAVFDKAQGIITFTDPISNDKYFIKTPPKLIANFEICCSRYGWLLMLKDDWSTVLYNPFTRDIRKLPQAPDGSVEGYCFSAPPTDPLCIVARFKKSVELLGCDVAYREDSKEKWEWRWIHLNLGYRYPCTLQFPTFHGQDVYALSGNGGIYVFRKLVEGLVCFIAELPKSCCKSTPVKRFLAICDQHLIQVVMDELGESTELFNLDESKKEWKKIDSLGKHMIYVCGTTCLCVEARKPEMENKIYFPRLRSKKIVFYSLETCRYHTFKNGETNIEEESFADFFQTEYYTYRNPASCLDRTTLVLANVDHDY
uniref:uncharacterized protein LOC122583065 n=1 Tax=Erigeron canadensis TaxID=72917 RepID=UPI001CB8D033|nr:uncharacterized protein LOC122583065 [Erigeron canadensis]